MYKRQKQKRVELIVGECEIYKEDRDALEEMRKLDECDVETFIVLDIREKTIALLGDRWLPRKSKQEGHKVSKTFYVITWKKRNERPNVGGVFIRSGHGAPS